MGLSFFETMRGELVDGQGAHHSIDFQIKAEASHLERFLRDGRTHISGVVHAPPWAKAVALQGTLRIAPFRDRRIVYDFDFGGDDGHRYQLLGEKNVSWRDPVRSLTSLHAQLMQRSSNGAEPSVVARGQLYFDLDELTEFLRSWWPTSGFTSRVLHRPLPDGKAAFAQLLSAREAQRLRALVEALLPAGKHVPAADAKTLHELDHTLRVMPSPVLELFRRSLRWLDLAARLHGGRSFAALPLGRRCALLETLAGGRGAGSRLPRSRQVLQFLTAPIKIVHFNRADYLAAVGYPAPAPVAVEPPRRYMERVTAPEALEEVTEVEAEVVIVGSGAGGAAIAKELAQRGVAVAIVEEGRFLSRAAFTGTPLERMQRLWRRAGTHFTVGRPPIAMPLGRAVGGTTIINSGTCFRAPDHVLRAWWHDERFPDDFRPDSFARHYDRVAEELQVAPGERRHLGRIAELVGRGADAMGLEHGPLPRNAPDCDGQGTCIFGCPTGAKRSADVALMPAALRAGAQLFVGLPVRRILMHGRRALGIEARGSDAYGAPRTVRIYAQHVVLSAGTVHTPILLRDNGFRLPYLGRNLSLHPGIGLLALCQQRMDHWNAIPQGYGVRGYEQEGICFEGFALPPAFLSTAVPDAGRPLTYWMDHVAQLAQFGFMVRDRGVGRVLRDASGRPVVYYSVTDDCLRLLRRGVAILAELLLRGGAQQVLGFGPQHVIRTIGDARRFEHTRVSPMDFNLLGAHPLGTCRMGRDADSAVVDFEHRLFGTDNLYVVDGSAVPTSLGVNPQMTIMAFAHRAGEIIASLAE